MNKRKILTELPRLDIEAQNETEDRDLLDREFEEYRRNPEAGSTWNEVETRIRKSSRS